MAEVIRDGTGSSFDAKVTIDNDLKVVTSDGLAISRGEVSGTNFVHKFGNSPDFDTTDGLVTIWDGADDGEINQMQYVYSTTNDIDSLISDNSSDTQVYEIQGLGANYEQIIQNATCAGSGYAAIGSPLMRIFRMKNIGNVDNVGHVHAFVSGASTAGMPDDSTSVKALIQPGNNQTLMAIYTIPSGCTGYMRNFFSATAGGNRDANYDVELRARTSGTVFQLKHKSNLQDVGTSTNQHIYNEPEKFTQFTDIEMQCSVLTSNITAASISAGFDLVLVNN